MQDAHATEFSHEFNIAITLREMGKGYESAASALERGEKITEATIADIEQATTEVVSNLRALLKAPVSG